MLVVVVAVVPLLLVVCTDNIAVVPLPLLFHVWSLSISILSYHFFPLAVFAVSCRQHWLIAITVAITVTTVTVTTAAITVTTAAITVTIAALFIAITVTTAAIAIRTGAVVCHV